MFSCDCSTTRLDGEENRGGSLRSKVDDYCPGLCPGAFSLVNCTLRTSLILIRSNGYTMTYCQAKINGYFIYPLF